MCVAKVTYQNLFRLFPKLSGMTGTAFTEADEFLEVYNLKVFPIPTALPLARRDNEDAVFRTKEGKMKVHICMYVCMYVFVCVYVCVYVCMYTHSYKKKYK